MNDFTKQQADALFQHAMELPLEARERYLDQHCAPGSALRALLERLLSACEDEAGALECNGGVRGHLWQALADKYSKEFFLAPGERIGAWEVVRTLGRGGMATVYLARRADGHFDQSVALKVLDIAHEYGELMGRFAQERRILATLDHPNIARLIDAGFRPSGQPYVAMEYVDGESIDAYCDRLALRIEQRIDLFAHVTAAVHHAHSHLIVHRDIKPSNVMITADGQPKLLDFGIAKLLDQSSPHAAPLTRSALHPMTPEYASPEQIRGEALTTASDVYQLGQLLYRLLTGCEPYRIERGKLDAIIDAICRVEPAPPSRLFGSDTSRLNEEELLELQRIAAARSATPAALRRRLSGDLDTIVLTALRKEPEQRYSSVVQFREDLRRHLQGRPITARTPTFRYRAGKFARRNRLAVAASILALLALTAGISATVWQAQAAAAQARRATEVRDFLVALFESVDPNSTLGETVSVSEVLDRGAEQLRAGLGDTPQLRAEMLGVVGRMYFELGLYPQARELFEQARTVWAAESASEERTQNLLDLARVLAAQGKYAEAEGLAREALATLRERFRPDPKHLANAIAVLANILKEKAETLEAESLYREAMQIDERASDEAAQARHLSAYSNLLYRTHRYDEAEETAQRALSLQRRMHGSEHTAVASSLLNLGEIVRARGDYQRAEGFLDEALSVRRTLLGNEHPAVADVYNDLGHLMQEAGRLDEAESAHRQALAIRLAAFGTDHPEYANSLNHLGIVQYFRLQYEAAADTFEDVLPIWRAIHGPSHPNVFAALNNLGAALREAGELKRAEAVLREVLQLRRTALGEQHREVAQSLNNLGLLLAKAHDDTEAETLMREGIAVWRATMGSDHPDVGDGLASLGTFLLQRERFADAEPVLRESLAIRARTLDADAPLLATARFRLGECLLRLGRVDEAAPLIETGVPTLISHFGVADPVTARAAEIRRELRGLRTAESVDLAAQ